jgi:trehalose 6-phosphate phosphatase
MEKMPAEPPLPKIPCALFLDFDGTLVELAARPDAVRPAQDLVPLLDRLLRHLDGAVAVITGRRIADIDHFLAPLRLPVAGVHGQELRRAAGEAARAAAGAPELDLARGEIAAFARARPGVRVEDKGVGLALHWREAPEAGAAAHALMAALHDAAQGRLALVEGKMVAELVPAGRDKGWAVERLVEAPPFAGRLAVFIGDDVTDEAGFLAVNGMGGLSIRVGGKRTESIARYRLPDPQAVQAWLAALADDMARARPPATGEGRCPGA